MNFYSLDDIPEDLRKYFRAAPEIGLEATPEAYVATLVAVFREVRRVLREDGTLWLNLGSSFCSAIIESDDYVISRSLANAQRRQVAKALSQVWGGNASPESAMQSLLAQGIGTATELPDARVSEMRSGVHDSQGADGERAGEILLKIVREVWQPDQKARAGGADVPDLQQEIGALPCGHAQERIEKRILQQGMLVQPQPAGQSLPLGGRPGRAHEPGRDKVAQGGAGAGQVSLPDLPCEPQVGSASHSAIRNAQGGALGCEQRAGSVSVVSQEHSTSRTRGGGDVQVHIIGACDGLEDLAFRKSVVPPCLLAWCEPKSIFKPKDLVSIPSMVAEALRADGWYLRSDIIWSKPNPMPESVTDRPTKAHEYLFLLAKSARYYYDAEAIKEPGIFTGEYKTPDGWDTSVGEGGHGVFHKNGREKGLKKSDKQRGHSRRHDGFNDRWDQMTKEEQCSGMRNKRTVWTVATQPYKDAHFATFPPKLIEPCILAGAPVGGMVLDPFHGAGTTMMVSKQLGRKYVGVELNQAYIDLSLKRIQQEVLAL